MADEQREKTPVSADPPMRRHRCLAVKSASSMICEVDQETAGWKVEEGRFCQKLFADVYPNSPAAADKYLGTLRSLTLPPGCLPTSPLSPPYSYASSYPHSFLLKLFRSFLSSLPLPVLIWLLWSANFPSPSSLSCSLSSFFLRLLFPPFLSYCEAKRQLLSMHTVTSQASQHIDLHNFIWLSANEKNNLADGRRLSNTGGILSVKSLLEDTYLVTTPHFTPRLHISLDHQLSLFSLGPIQP